MPEDIQHTINISLLGYSPEKITYSSDYFQELYDYAKLLISQGHAFVCHQKQLQETTAASPWRERPIQQSLELFEVITVDSPHMHSLDRTYHFFICGSSFVEVCATTYLTSDWHGHPVFHVRWKLLF